MIVRSAAVATRATRVTTRSAFTLMEIMVVVAIIVILAGVSVVGITHYMEEAKISATRAKINTIETAAGTYYTKHGEYPTDLTILTSNVDGGPAALETSQIKDEWQQPIVIDVSQRSATGKPLIYSNGPPGENRRISNQDQQ